MSKKHKAIFISDSHLGSLTEPRFVLFTQFLKQLCSDKDLTHLFLVGDIFDLWIGAHEYFIDKYKDVIEPISELVKNGVSVNYFEGNHDLYLHDFWANEVGVNVCSQPEVFELGDLSVRVEHGDQIDPNDQGYIFLRWFLRTAGVRFFLTHLPESLIVRVGEKASQSSREYTSVGRKALDQEATLIKFETYAKNLAKSESWSYLVAGHIHIRECIELDGSGRLAINLGVWDESPQFLQIVQGSEPVFLPISL